MKAIFFCLILFLSVCPAYSADSYTARLKSGIEAVNEGDFSQARSIFDELVLEYPDRSEPLCGLAIVNISIGNFEIARENLLKAVHKNKAYSQTYYLLGMVEEQMKNYAAALKYYSLYLDKEPDSLHKDRILKKIYYLKQKVDE